MRTIILCIVVVETTQLADTRARSFFRGFDYLGGEGAGERNYEIEKKEEKNKGKPRAKKNSYKLVTMK